MCLKCTSDGDVLGTVSVVIQINLELPPLLFGSFFPDILLEFTNASDTIGRCINIQNAPCHGWEHQPFILVHE